MSDEEIDRTSPYVVGLFEEMARLRSENMVLRASKRKRTRRQGRGPGRIGAAILEWLAGCESATVEELRVATGSNHVQATLDRLKRRGLVDKWRELAPGGAGGGSFPAHWFLVRSLYDATKPAVRSDVQGGQREPDGFKE